MIQETKELGYSIVEETFFVHPSSVLLHHLRIAEQKTEARHQLAQISGIHNEAVLNELLEQDITAATVAALPLTPLILTAWADGSMEPAERLAIQKAMHDHGMIPSQPVYALLETWLDDNPGPLLFDLWRIYVQGIRESMDVKSFADWKNRIMDRAEFIAAAAGGFMGIGFTISAAEKTMLIKLEKSFFD